MVKHVTASVLLAGVAISLIQAVQQNSIGWGSVAVCLMIFASGWGAGEQLTRVLNRLDDIVDLLRRGNSSGLRLP